MKKGTPSKIVEVILHIILVGILIAPLVYILFTIPSPDKAFWDNSIGNLLATVLALVAGIPIAFNVDRFIQEKQNKEKFQKDRARESEVLTVIKEELEFSYKSLFLGGKKGDATTMTIQPLKSDVWGAVSASGEIRYIGNIKLINRITSAYYVLHLVKDIEHQAYIALRTSAITFTKNGQQLNAAQLLLRDARSFDTLFEKSILEALEAINKRIEILKK